MSGSERGLGVQYAGRVGDFELDVAFEAPGAGVTAVFGPSGAGKTVLLRCIAGLTRLPGRLVVGGQVWDDEEAGLRRPTHQRPVGYVFQEASLFAHLSVRHNLLFGHRRAVRSRVPRIRPDEVIELLGVEPLLDRRPLALSGGERQRVAIGRALLSQPEILLMDEPLAALDRTVKDEILPYLEAVRTTLEIPVLYVTHDLGEVERLADHLVLLVGGRVQARGPLHQVVVDLRAPLARSAEAATLLECRVIEHDEEDAVSVLECEGAQLLAPGDLGPCGATLRVRISAHDVSLTLDRPLRTTILNVLPARIEQVVPLERGRVNVLLRLGDEPGDFDRGPRLLARVTERSARALRLAPGLSVHAQIKAVSLVDARTADQRERRASM